MNEKLQTAIDALRPLVTEIESKPAITKDHYDAYLVALDRVGKMLHAKTESNWLMVGYLLIQAGANRNGVRSALGILGYPSD